MPVESLEDLADDFWPEDESADDFLSWLRKTRPTPTRQPRPGLPPRRTRPAVAGWLN